MVHELLKTGSAKGDPGPEEEAVRVSKGESGTSRAIGANGGFSKGGKGGARVGSQPTWEARISKISASRVFIFLSLSQASA